MPKHKNDEVTPARLAKAEARFGDILAMRQAGKNIKYVAREVHMGHQVMGKIIRAWEEAGRLPIPPRSYTRNPNAIRSNGTSKRPMSGQLERALTALAGTPWVSVTRQLRIPPEHWEAAWKHHRECQRQTNAADSRHAQLVGRGAENATAPMARAATNQLLVYGNMP